jgi:hypothetical protein
MVNDLNIRMRPLSRMQPARRGRAKKVVAAITPLEESTHVVVQPDPPKEEKGKKSKKPVKVVAVVTPTGIQGSFTPEPRRPLIAHLSVHSSEVKFHDVPIQYDPNPPSQPEPYDINYANVFTSTQEVLEELVQVEEKEKEEDSLFEKKEEQTDPTEKESRPLQLFTRADLMVEYRDSQKTKQIPESTNIACFWCAHTFTGQPCIVPEREEKGVYRVYGNFCCPSCALSFLLHETLDPHVRWERMALLNRIYDRDGVCRVFPAPSREVLDLFGGPISIESYRATIASKRVRVDVHMPPMVSILGSIDTKPIDFFDSSLKNTLINPVPFEKQVKSEDGLRLKRSKPLKDKESTLDAVMNIQIKLKK